jgi:hypothetical protein
VLKDKDASDQILFNRAKVRHWEIVPTSKRDVKPQQGLMIIGHIFKSAIPDETDEERRELERCVLLLSGSARTNTHYYYSN